MYINENTIMEELYKSLSLCISFKIMFAQGEARKELNNRALPSATLKDKETIVSLQNKILKLRTKV